MKTLLSIALSFVLIQSVTTGVFAQNQPIPEKTLSKNMPMSEKASALSNPMPAKVLARNEPISAENLVKAYVELASKELPKEACEGVDVKNMLDTYEAAFKKHMEEFATDRGYSNIVKDPATLEAMRLRAYSFAKNYSQPVAANAKKAGGANAMKSKEQKTCVIQCRRCTETQKSGTL